MWLKQKKQKNVLIVLTFQSLTPKETTVSYLITLKQQTYHPNHNTSTSKYPPECQQLAPEKLVSYKEKEFAFQASFVHANCEKFRGEIQKNIHR